jgi:hypothetical protein
MSWWQPVTPGWVRPCTFAVSDLHTLAYRAFDEARSPCSAGMVAALVWVRGGRDAPVTGRVEQPVTRQCARFEQWAAVAVVDEDTALPAPPLHGLAQMLGVVYLPPRPVGSDWAHGVWRVLRWLDGATGAKPPLAVPSCRPDGTLRTESDLLEQLITENPALWLDPASRARVTTRAAAAARDNQRLADRVTDTLARFAHHPEPEPAAPDPAVQRYVYRPVTGRGR